MKKIDIKNFEECVKAKNEFDGNLRFGAKKFHAETNRSGQGRPSSGYLIREHAKVVVDTGAERYQCISGVWEDVDTCPACSSKDREKFLTRFALDIYRCCDCTHRYLNPRVKFDEAMKIYADDKTASDIYTQPLQKEIDRIKYSYGLELIEQLDPPSIEKIMDIGCGAGVFLEVAFERGWKSCVGVDVNERYADIYADAKGVQFINSTFEALDASRLGSGYDCVAMWSVLEHLYDVHNIIRAVKGLLKDGGLLFILVPNVESLATRLMREMSPVFAWKHLSHFSPKSLKHLMAIHGFDCVRFETVITEIDNIKSYMSGEYPYHGHGDPDGLFDFVTPEYIYRHNLGSRMIGIFKNVKR
ncbi:MAG: class I SAM-dependent methyltransferase [Deltaproteobacteria bacterium]|nr:class I SAM-dependent methyltransferase [Deltaproteobacteria bacterium]